MEISQLEVSTQRHIDRIQETAKVNYVHYGKGSKNGKGKPRPSGGSGSGSSSGSGGSRVNAGNTGKPSGKSRKVPLMSVGDVEKVGTRKVNLVKLWKPCVETVEQRGTMRKCMKMSTYLVNVPGISTTSAGSADYQLDYFNEHGDPVYAHMVHAKEINQKKHLIQFPISVNLEKGTRWKLSRPSVQLFCSRLTEELM